MLSSRSLIFSLVTLFLVTLTPVWGETRYEIDVHVASDIGMGDISVALFDVEKKKLATSIFAFQNTTTPINSVEFSGKPISCQIHSKSSVYVISGAKITDTRTGKTLFCMFNGWLYNQRPSIEASLEEGSEYCLTLHVGEKKNSGRDGHLQVRLEGDAGTTRTFRLYAHMEQSSSHKFVLFSRVRIGTPQEVVVYVDNEDALYLTGVSLSSQYWRDGITIAYENWINPNCPFPGSGAKGIISASTF